MTVCVFVVCWLLFAVCCVLFGVVVLSGLLLSVVWCVLCAGCVVFVCGLLFVVRCVVFVAFVYDVCYLLFDERYNAVSCSLVFLCLGVALCSVLVLVCCWPVAVCSLLFVACCSQFVSLVVCGLLICCSACVLR